MRHRLGTLYQLRVGHRRLSEGDEPMVLWTINQSVNMNFYSAPLRHGQKILTTCREKEKKTKAKQSRNQSRTAKIYI